MSEDRYDCPYCKSGKWYPHRMDYSKVKVLKEIALINKEYEWVKIQQDSSLIKDNEKDFTIQTDAVHASRLFWFGLIDKRSSREGLVKINRKGIDFLRGKFKVPSRIWVSRGELRESEPPFVDITQIKGVVLDKAYWDNYPGVEYEN